MKDNPLKWLIKGPIYIFLSPLWVLVWVLAWTIMITQITFGWAFSNRSWIKEYKRQKLYDDFFHGF